MSRDGRVEAAITNWAPRFLANGVPYIDFVEVTEGLTSWDDWCSAWSARAAVHEQLGSEALAAGHTRTAGEHLVRAAVEYHFAKYLFVDDPDQLRVAHERAVACHRAALPHLDPPGQRIEIAFDGATIVGNLRLPRGAGPEPVPVVVMVMGLDSAKEEMGTNEQPFLDRGMATFAFDGPGQGEGEEGLVIRPDYEAPVAAVLDVLAARPELDADRIGLWGVSLGGYSAPRAAAFEPRVRACIGVSGPYDLGEAWDGLPPLTRAAFAARSGAVDAEDAAARAARLRLAGVAERITCPLLVVFGGRDRLFDVAHAQRLVAEAAGPAELLLVDDGNHVVNDRPYRYRSQAADWIAHHLQVS
jgi:dipeptidyl aminopeptidase/acylaminoacyl peptidase